MSYRLGEGSRGDVPVRLGESSRAGDASSEIAPIPKMESVLRPARSPRLDRLLVSRLAGFVCVNKLSSQRDYLHVFERR